MLQKQVSVHLFGVSFGVSLMCRRKIMIPSDDSGISTETTRELTSDELDAVSAGAQQAYIHLSGQKSGKITGENPVVSAVASIAVAVVNVLK